MIKKMIYLVCLLLGLPLFAEEDSALLPDVVYVDCAYWGENGEMTGDYNTPYNTIQQGVDSVNTNGVVIVAPGTYEGALSITNAPLTLLASGSAIDTVITRQWGDNGTIVNIGSNAAGSSIIGFTIQGGFGEVGANLSCNGSVDIKDCVIKDNAYNYYEHDTGSVYVGGENVIVNMENCLVIGTCFGWCSVIFVDGDGETGAVLRIDRSTILASNYYEGTSNIICADGNSIIKCHNSILGGCLESDNTVLFALGGAYDGNPPQFEVAYSCIEGEVGFDAYSDLNVIDGGGNIFCDPCFVDRYSSNFTIEEWSPCRDAANEDLPLDPDGSRVDMGYSETRFGIGKIFNSDEFFYELSEEGAVITLVSNKTEHVAFPMMIDGKVVVGIGQEYGESVFADPTSVVTVDIPSTVKYLGGFEGCRSLKEIEIPEGVVTIGSFEYCSSLSRVKIPASVSGMYFYAFRHCFIAYFEVDENNRHYSSDSVGSLFNKDQTVLIRVAGGGDTYSSWVGLYGYHLPNTVGYIAEGACSGVQPQYNITMTLPKSVTNIAANAISHCLRVKIYVASDNECFKSDAYGDAIYNSDGTVLISYHGNDSHFTVPSSVTNIAYLAFMGSIGLNTVTIPDSVTSVGQFAFCWCEDLESVTLPKNVETLDWTFAQCSNLKKVVMPDGSKIKNLFDGMFQFCSNLTEVVLTEGVERIVGPVFWNCRSLPELIIPESVKEFSGSSECFALTNLSFKGAPPKLWSGRKFDDSHLAIGYYRAKYASEWQAALDSEGKYAGIPMFQRAMVTNKVTFVVGDKGLHTGGGSLEQDVFDETAAESPLITANEGWRFVGWDADISNVISNTTVNAVYKRDLITVVPFEEDVAFDGSVANVYDGWLVDENGDLAGIVQVKAAKQTVKKGVANFTATATVTDLNGKKWSYSKGVGAADGVVAGLSCTAKGVPVTSFNVSLGGNSLSGEYGKCKIIGARNGMGIKGDPMKVSLEEHYLQKNYSLAFENEDGISRLQFIVGAKGVVKIAGQVPGGFKMNASVQGVMGEDALYIPCCAILKNGKNNKNVMILARIKNDGSVEILDNNLGNVLAAGETQTFVSLVEGDVFYAHITQCKGGEEYNGTVVIPELSYPAKFSAKGLPSGLKIDAGTGVVTGTPKKPGKYLVEFTIVSGINSKSKIVFEYEFIVMNFSAANGCFKEGIRNAADEKYSLSAGVSNIADFLPNLALKSITAKLSVSGLPAGLKYDAKTGKITGIATKPGTYTVTLTVTDGKAKYVSTITIEVEALPDWVVGTFDGDSLGECAVSGSDYLGVSSLSVSSVGKITGKISFANAKTIPFALNGFTAIENDAYIARGVVKVGNIEYATEIEVERSAYSSSGSVVYKGGVDILMEANSNTDEGIPSIVECELEQNIWASKNHVLPIIDTKSTFYVAPDTDSEKTFSIKFGNKGVATVGYWADLSLSKMTKSGSVPVILVEYDSLNSIWHGQLVLNSITNVGIDNESPVVIDVYFDENGDVFFLCPEVSPMPLSWFAGTYTGSVYEDGILGSYSGSITAKIDAKGTISAVMDWDSGVRRNIKCTCAKIVNRNECKLTGKVNFEGYTFDVEIDINIDGTASMRAEAPIDRIWGDNLYKQE